jgi:methylthioribose-1-phosphate isomerase
MRDEADAIATEAQLAHAALGRAGAEAISAHDGNINVLMHGDSGPLSCGMVGTGTALLQNLTARGHHVHVWVTDVAPGMEGTRIAAFQLTQMEVPHTVIPDTAVSWVLSTRKLDGTLLRGDTVGANAETLAPVGSLNVAQLAADAGVAVYVLTPPSSIATPGVDPAGLLLDLRSPTESGARSGTERASRPPALEARLTPTTDLIPGRLVTAFITETGLRPAGRP